MTVHEKEPLVQGKEEKDDDIMSEVETVRSATHDFDPAHYRVYTKRWAVLASFALLTITNAATWICYSQVTKEVSKHYGVSKTWVDTLSTIFMFMYIPVNWPASWCLERFGVRTGVLIGAGLTALGTWLRYAGQNHTWFWVVMVGQGLAAAGQPFLLNAPPKLSSVWFAEDQRAIATTIGSASQLLGVAMGFVLPPAIVDKNPSNVNFLNLIFAIMCSATFAVALLVVQKEPPTPPSPSAGSPVLSHDVLRDMKRLFADPTFVLLFVSFGLGLGAFNTLATLLNQIVEPWGYGDSDSGMFGALNIVCGLVGSAIAGAYLDSSHRYKEVLCVSLLGGCAMLHVFWSELAHNNYTILCITCAGAGGFLTPTIPVAMEMAAEVTFPLDESQSAGVLMLAGQIVGIATIFGFQTLIDDDRQRFAALLTAIIVSVAALIALPIGGRKGPVYKRRLFEKEGKTDFERQSHAEA